MSERSGVAGGLFIAVGLIVAGLFIGGGLSRMRQPDRFVTVKGVAEREVMADVALWPLLFNAAGNDLAAAQGTIDRGIARAMAFLAERGIDTSTVEYQGLRVNDLEANPYRDAPPGSRYVINQTVIVRSNEPERVQRVSEALGELVGAGVALTSGAEYGPGGPTYLFTKLNDIKPSMIAEATARAREAAEQFAQDSGSRLGGIRRANQGIFEILPRDQAPGIQAETQIRKTVRVVSTVEYLLKD